MKREQSFYKAGYRVLVDGKVISKSGKEISGRVSHGYLMISSRCKFKYCAVHRLQAYQKYADSIYEKGIEVRHLNNNSFDNSFDNIGIGTHKDNMRDCPQSIRMAKSLYATSFIRKYDKCEVVDFYHKNDKSYKKTMLHFNISSKGTLHFILNGRPKINT